jgi:hypothetical protein
MRYIAVLFLVLCAAGCEPREEKKPVVIKIGGIQVTADEFNEAYERSMFVPGESNLTKKEFLDTFVKRRLLLREAEKLNLHTDERFLKSVEYFWQQSLLKLVIDRQLKEISAKTDVTEKDVRDYYEANKANFGGKTYEEKRERIKFMLLREKQQKALEDWMDGLKNNTNVTVDAKAIGLES